MNDIITSLFQKNLQNIIHVTAGEFSNIELAPFAKREQGRGFAELAKGYTNIVIAAADMQGKGTVLVKKAFY